MASLEPGQGNVQSRMRHLRTRRLIVAACLLVLAAITLLSLHLLGLGQNAGATLAQIDAAHVIPDDQNAARDYTSLALRGANTLLIPMPLAADARTATMSRPWRSAEFPEMAKWIEQRRTILDVLLQASRKPACWIPLDEPQSQPGEPSTVALFGTPCLLQAANNDFGEGRPDAGMEKLLYIFQMAEHFRSQMNLSHRMLGMSSASEGLKRSNRLLVTEEVSQEWLTRLEAVLPPVKNVDDKEFRQLLEIRRLRFHKYRNFRDRLLYTLAQPVASSPGERRIYSAHVAEFRATRILLALRRHKNNSGTWPATLADIEGRIPPEALIDPLTNKPFVYRRAGDSFLLYNVGPNGADEGGESGDDYHFWPPSQRWAGSVKY
jgi:hypothetical protein